MFDSVAMSKNPNGKRLNESQRCEIIAKLSKTDAANKKAIACEYDVNEGAIRKVWDKREQILERFALMCDEVKEKTFRSSIGRFTELEDMLYIWIDNMLRANLPVPPSLTIAKVKSIASSLSIPKTSWQWLRQFKVRQGLQKMLLHGEGAEVNKSDLGLLAPLDDLYAIITQYDPENVYNMDETGLFFCLLPRYSLLMPDEDISTTRGKKKSKDRVSFIVCANAVGSHKIPCALIGKPKAPACIKDRQWPIPYFIQTKAWMDVETCWKWFNEVFLPEVKK
jgi:transposase-like protein